MAFRTYSAPTPHPVRSQQVHGAESKNGFFLTFRTLACVRGCGRVCASRARTWLFGREGKEGTEYGTIGGGA